MEYRCSHCNAYIETDKNKDSYRTTVTVTSVSARRKTVTRYCGSTCAILGQLGSLAGQLSSVSTLEGKALQYRNAYQEAHNLIAAVRVK